MLNYENIPYRQLGYSTLEQFLSTIPDIKKKKDPGTGEILYIALTDTNTAHIASLVGGQKTSSKARKHKAMVSPAKSTKIYIFHGAIDCFNFLKLIVHKWVRLVF